MADWVGYVAGYDHRCSTQCLGQIPVLVAGPICDGVGYPIESEGRSPHQRSSDLGLVDWYFLWRIPTEWRKVVVEISSGVESIQHREGVSQLDLADYVLAS